MQAAKRHDRAYARARARNEGTPLAPLAGVPLSIKDLFDTAGVTTAYGSRIYAGHVPDRDAVGVARAERAGTVALGKTVTHEFAWGVTGESSATGPARNPWDTERITGGSSAGAAASVAAGHVPLALGTDTAGSVRIPAALCGVAGFKPTYGALATTGVFPLAPAFDHVGILAGRPADARALFAALLATAPTSFITEGLRTGGDGLRGVRVGVFVAAGAPALGLQVRSAFDEALATLGGLGATVDPASPPGLGSDAMLTAFGVVQAAEALAVHRGRGLFPARAAEYQDDVRDRLEAAALADPMRVVPARAEIAALRRRLIELARSYDVLVSPVAAIIAPRPGETSHLRSNVLPFTLPQSIGGLPSCVVRVGFDAGLPIGLQVFGSPYRDFAVLDVADRLFAASATLQHRRPALPAPRCL